jgi:STE24 endopeptidase
VTIQAGGKILLGSEKGKVTRLNITGYEIFCIYLVCFAIYVLVEESLLFLNLRHVDRMFVFSGGTPPTFFAQHIDAATYGKSVEYTKSRIRLSMLSTAYSSLLLLLFIACGWFGLLDSHVRAAIENPYIRGVVFVFLLNFIFNLLSLPFSLYSTFVIEERYGFNKMNFRTWLTDQVKIALVSLVLLAPLLFVLLYFMANAGVYWWLYAFLLVTTFQLFIFYVYPIWIAPLFNSFRPLQDESLLSDIHALCTKTGFPAGEVFVMDGSRRSAHANAYFTGFGRNKRIVLFDTLVNSLSRGQILSVLAHEIGHERLNHIKKSLVLSIALLLPTFWLLAVLMKYPAFYEAFGFSEASEYAALVIFSFAATPITYFAGPLFSIMSRRFEFQADRFAVDAVGGAEDLSSALLGMSKKSLSNLTPHPWYSFFHYSHPTLAERLPAMQKHRERSQSL